MMNEASSASEEGLHLIFCIQNSCLVLDALSTGKQVTEALPPASAMDPPTISICMIYSINIDLPLAGQKGHHQVNLLL